VFDWLWQLDHAKPEHQAWLRRAYGWAVTRFGERVKEAGYENEASFLTPPPGATEFMICQGDTPWALLTFIPDNTECVQYRVGLIPAPGIAVRALLRILEDFKRGLRLGGVQRLRAVLPNNLEYDAARRLARRLGFQQSEGDWFLELHNGADAQQQ